MQNTFNLVISVWGVVCAWQLGYSRSRGRFSCGSSAADGQRLMMSENVIS